MNGSPKHPNDDNRWRYLASALAFVFILLLCILLWPNKEASTNTEKGGGDPSSLGEGQSDMGKSAQELTGVLEEVKSDANKDTSIEPINIDLSNATNALALYSPDIGLTTEQGNKNGPKQPGTAPNSGGKNGPKQPGSVSSGSLTIKNSPGSKAITKGSFTVWTVPEDPGPGQSYWIVIQVKHKKALVNYTRTDLSGTVVGTDNYRALIASHQPAKFLVKSNMARLALKIPGGAKLVKDVIKIKSSMLNEAQTVTITF